MQLKILGERYELQEKIGEGGMASIFRAKDLRLKRDVAIKILHERLTDDKEILSRFLREAQSAARLSHPNIVNVYDVEEDHGVNYIVMEYLKTGNLKEYLFEKAPLPLENAFDIFQQIGKAVQYAHENGIIHRDLKPQNVLISGENQVKVTDFGIARAISSSSLTQTGSMMGSVQYFSPEQAQGKPVDKTTDIYSLGIILFECLTGRLPFDGDNPVAVALKQVQENPPAPSSFNNKISKSVDAAVFKALSKNPAERYQDVNEFIDAINEAFFIGRNIAAEKANFIKKPAEKARENQTLIIKPSDYANISKIPSEALKSTKVKEESPKIKTPPKKNFPVYVIILVIFLFVATFFAFSNGILKPFFSPSAVPDLEGFTLAKAREIADKRGWQINIKEEKFDNRVPEGVIISQDPPRGTDLPRGGNITVVISKGNLVVEIPDLRGLPEDKALENLTRLGLRGVIKREIFSDTVEKDLVISHEPGPQEMVPPGEKIYLTLSKGAEKTKVPDLAGLNQDEAKKILSKLGLTIVISGREPSDKILENCIISQTPKKGDAVDKGSQIKVVISTGPEMIKAPDLAGKKIFQAREFLTPMGIKITVDEEEAYDDNSVIAGQSPEAGEPLKSDHTIVVWCVKPVEVPSLTGLSLEEAQNTIDKNGFKVGVIDYQYKADTNEGTVLAQKPAAGAKAEKGSKINLTLSTEKSPSNDANKGDKAGKLKEF